MPSQSTAGWSSAQTTTGCSSRQACTLEQLWTGSEHTPVLALGCQCQRLVSAIRTICGSAAPCSSSRCLASDGLWWRQVYINGTTSNGSFESYNNYINFRPRNYSRDSEVFNVCALAPQVQPDHQTSSARQHASDACGDMPVMHAVWLLLLLHERHPRQLPDSPCSPCDG